jgi:hypothetical protein
VGNKGAINVAVGIGNNQNFHPATVADVCRSLKKKSSQGVYICPEKPF